MVAANRTQQPPMWTFRRLESDFSWEGPLLAYWEVLLDPISDAYTPAGISAADLLDRWAREARRECPGGLVPIFWFLECASQIKFEPLPFQLHLAPGAAEKDFLSFYTWPVNAKTGEDLNWLTLPVVDKWWNSARCTTGGFIQEATGWKPAILQPFVYLPALLSSAVKAGSATRRAKAARAVQAGIGNS